jgi:tetratricopeptide (TPR) repeat protein
MTRKLPVSAALLAFTLACTTPLQRGERLYHDGDRLGALEVWRAEPDDARESKAIQARITVVETEFERLVVQYKQRARYYEGKERLAEALLNYRLALKLQPHDAETLAHVQLLARTLDTRKTRREESYRAAFDAGDLPAASRQLSALRQLDPFDHELETDERQLQRALRVEIDRRMAEGRNGFASGNHEGSARAFRAALELDPDNESARGYLSYIATLRREAQASAQRPVPFEAGGFATDAEIRAEGFYQNALAAEHNGDPYAAIRNDLHALRADPKHTVAREHLDTLRSELAPQVPVLVEEGRTAFKAEDLQSALDLWRRALLLDPANERVIAYIGRAEQQLENLERLRSEPDVASGGS